MISLMPNRQTGPEGKSRLKRLLPLLLALLLLLVVAALLHFAKQPAKPAEASPSPSSFDTRIDSSVTAGNTQSERKEDIQNALNKQVADGMISISMNTRPIFETGSSAGNLLIVNDRSNKHMQIVEIYRDDTGALIYRSGGIPVGGQIGSAKLDAALIKGVYPCTAYFNAVDDTTGALLGKAGAKIEITVQN